MPQKWDSRHQGNMINNWIKYGLLLREGETYKGIYSFVMSIDNCQLCSVKFNDEVRGEWRCMDHSHETGFFRQVLCNKCNWKYDVKRTIQTNNKLGHMWIHLDIDKKKKKVLFRYTRKGFKGKRSVSLTKLIAYSFIQLIKITI